MRLLCQPGSTVRASQYACSRPYTSGAVPVWLCHTPTSVRVSVTSVPVHFQGNSGVCRRKLRTTGTKLRVGPYLVQSSSVPQREHRVGLGSPGSSCDLLGRGDCPAGVDNTGRTRFVRT
eukprot:1751815-Rhodomonas_salina.4